MEVEELSVKRGDVRGKEEALERSEEVECKGEFLVVCVGELLGEHAPTPPSWRDSCVWKPYQPI